MFIHFIQIANHANNFLKTMCTNSQMFDKNLKKGFTQIVNIYVPFVQTQQTKLCILSFYQMNKAYIQLALK